MFIGKIQILDQIPVAFKTVLNEAHLARSAIFDEDYDPFLILPKLNDFYRNWTIFTEIFKTHNLSDKLILSLLSFQKPFQIKSSWTNTA